MSAAAEFETPASTQEDSSMTTNTGALPDNSAEEVPSLSEEVKQEEGSPGEEP